MKAKVVVTRNFKGQTPAKYCAMIYGQDPSRAVELESLNLENVRFVSTSSDRNLESVKDWGCGIVAIGETDDLRFARLRSLRFNGYNFVDGDNNRVEESSVVEFSPEGILAR